MAFFLLRTTLAISFLCLLFFPFSAFSKIILGSDRLFEEPYIQWIREKKIGIITNQTGVDSSLKQTYQKILDAQINIPCKLVAIFAPEHGLRGDLVSEAEVSFETLEDGTPVYPFSGTASLPQEHLKEVEVLIYDLQDIGCRSYTYLTVLCKALEAASLKNIPVIVLDRPNPINGIVVDGPLLEEAQRSPVGYLNVPYCHGMTSGELAHYCLYERKLNCKLYVVPMEGWKRSMTFLDTGLQWIPSSPYIPEAATPLYYPLTGIIGALSLTSIGIGYTLPFQVIGAPWIKGEVLASAMKAHNLPGVAFIPWNFRPFYGKYGKKFCGGILIRVLDPLRYLPVTTQYALIGTLKTLYPKQIEEQLKLSNISFCNKVNGTERIYKILTNERYPGWKLREVDLGKRTEFLQQRLPFLMKEYQD